MVMQFIRMFTTLNSCSSMHNKSILYNMTEPRNHPGGTGRTWIGTAAWEMRLDSIGSSNPSGIRANEARRR